MRTMLYKCDKCGKDIVDDPRAQYFFPHYDIIRRDSTGYSSTVDLCNKCQSKLNEWINSKEAVSDDGENR